MEQAFCDEESVYEILIDICRENGALKPTILVSARDQKPRSFMYEATFVIITDEGNEELIRAINKWSAKNDRMIQFFHSEINLQNGDLTADYIMVKGFVAAPLT